MSLPLHIQRVAEHKDGWKFRFGCVDEIWGPLIVTVIVSDRKLLPALATGYQIAEARIAIMQAFNAEKI